MICTKVTKTCHGCPTIFEFETECGYKGYIKFRYGYLSVRVYDERFDYGMAVIHGEQISDQFDGVIDWDEVLPYITPIDISDTILHLTAEYDD